MDTLTIIQNSIDFIEDNILTQISIDELANNANMSGSGFQRIFLSLCGISVGQYIRNRKLTLAGKEIIQTNTKIVDIAFKYGYESHESFSRAFLNFHNVSPSFARVHKEINTYSKIHVKSIIGGVSMILSDKTLSEIIENKQLVVEPLEEYQVQAASIDIRLGNTFSIVEDTPNGIINMDNEVKYKMITTDKYIILPGQFVLATTMEYFELPNDLTAFVEGRSSLGRLGLFIQNAGWVDPGFKGEITLELFNANKCAIELQSGRRIGQLVFSKLDQDALNPYNGKYQGQKGATGSKVYKDNEIK